MSDIRMYALGKKEGKDFAKCIKLNEDCVNEIEILAKEYVKYVKEKNKIEYNPEYELNENDCYFIKDYALNDTYVKKIFYDNPNYFVSNRDKEGVTGICLFYMNEENEKYLVFQKWNKNICSLDNRFTFMLDKDTFNIVKSTIFTIDNEFICLIEHNNDFSFDLYFQDYKRTNSILGLNYYFANVLKNDIDNFVNHDFFKFENIDYFKGLKDNSFQLKVSNILKNKNLVSKWESPENIQRIAKEHNIDIELKEGKIYLPKTKKAILEIIGVLDEDYYKGAFTSDIYKSNKKVKNSK